MSTQQQIQDFIVGELKDLLNSAKKESDTAIKKNAEKLEKWLKYLALGEIDKKEFNSLVEGQKLIMQQFLNTQEIKSRAKLEKVTVGVLDIALNSVF